MRYYLGVMSGTSLDGVDLALMDFSKNTPHFSPQLVATDFVEMPQDLRCALSDILKSGQVSLQQLGELDHRLGLLYADCINRFLSKHQVGHQEIQAIGCHGQTIWHAPQGAYPFTMQIGDGNLIAARTGITTIMDFRRRDMALGGQGAPLVPAFHQALFFDPARITVVLNIGGISNISVLIPGKPVIGYDTGTGNALMDIWIEKHLGKKFDENGQWAATGQVQEALLQDLLNEPYFQQLPPKSTGRELFNFAWLEKKCQLHTALSAQDVQATLLEFTARCTAQDLQSFSPSTLPCLLLLCGGGAKNGRLKQRFAELLPTWQVSTTTEYGLDVDYVEAAAFAWLAYCRMNHLPANVPSVTGAKSAVSLGAVYFK